VARKRRGLALNGWLNMDKAEGMTSTQVVGRVRALTGAAKVGHGGTLDPLATGVLPIALGEATKTVPYLVDSDKEYEFVIRWGAETTTDDSEGPVVETSEVRPGAVGIGALLPRFIGDIEQVPPAFSAIKVNGERAYDIARQGGAVTLAARTVTVRSLSLLPPAPGFADVDHATLAMCCGKGTYVRSLARDLARALGTRGHVVALRRTRVGPFHCDQAISLDKLGELVHSAPPEASLLPVETALDGIPAVAVTGSEAKRLRLGQTLCVPNRKSGIVRVITDDGLIALATLKEGELKPHRIFNI